MSPRRIEAPSTDVVAAPDARGSHDSREAQLLAIARRLFARDGFERTSLRDIAEAADVTKAALYYYFPNKEALYERVVLESMQMLVDEVSAAVAQADSPTARIRAFMEASATVFENARDRWVAGSRAFREAGGRGGQHRAAIALRDGYESLLRECIADAIASGDVRAVDPAIAGRFLLSSLNQMASWYRPGGRLGVPEVMRQFLDMALNGLLVEARPAAVHAPAPARRAAVVLVAAAMLTAFTGLAPRSALAQPAAAAPAASSAPFPGGPTTLIVPYAAGGLTDNLARALGQRLAERWGQPVVVDNRAGGGTVIGTAAAARAPADGRTLLVTSFGFTTNPFMVSNLPYKPSQLEPLAMIAVAPAILFVHPSVPADDVPSLVKYIRTSGKPFAFASSGNGSSPHIGAELFASRIGVPIVHVPYRGNGPGLTDLIGGQVQGMFDSKAALSYVQAGKLKAIGISSLAPSSLAPGLKPIAQSGVPELAGFTTGSWFGVLVPEATPKPVQARLYADIRAVLDTPGMREAIDRSGVEPLLMTQAEFAAYLKSEAERWGPVIRDKNIKAD